MKMSVHSARILQGKQPRSLIVRTTLYDLVAAVSAEVRADEEDLTIATVVHLLKTRRVTHHGTLKHSRLVVRQSSASRRRRRSATTTTPLHPENIGG